MWISTVRWSAMCARRAELTGRCNQVIVRTCHVTRHCATCCHRVDSPLSRQWSRSGTWSIRPQRDLLDPKNQLPIWYVFRPAGHACNVRPSSVNTYSAWRGIPVLSAVISMKLTTNIHHVSGHCLKGFQGHGIKGQGHVATAIKSCELNCLWTAKGNWKKIAQIHTVARRRADYVLEVMDGVEGEGHKNVRGRGHTDRWFAVRDHLVSIHFILFIIRGGQINDYSRD